ncbi:MAG: hypothetical protein IPP32_03265 [Bacteroidetes bacterium]|nr:hypothetical protein [Bacteroidota bacterium]
MNKSAIENNNQNPDLKFQKTGTNSTLVTKTTSRGKYELEVFSFAEEDIEEIKKLREEIDLIPDGKK